VFTDTLNNWVSTRNVWNQHTYHVTNVCSGLSDGFCPETDNFYGRIPKNEMSNWQSKTLDNYRQNVQGVSGFLAPDFIVAGYTLINIECPDSLGIRVSVRNIGDAPAGGGGGSQDQDGGTGDGGTDDGGTLPLTGVPVALYKGDPLSGGVAVGVGYTDRRMDPGGYATAVVWWYNAPAGEWPRSDLWIVVNDDGKGGRAYNECRTDNNYLHMPITYCKKEG
jgi:hypothetical protein